MGAIGFFVLWVGYSVFYYGFDQIRGGNNGFLDLTVPGRYKALPTDGQLAGKSAPPSQPGGNSGDTGGASQLAGPPASTVGLGPAPVPSIPASGLLSGNPVFPAVPTGPTTTPVAGLG